MAIAVGGWQGGSGCTAWYKSAQKRARPALRIAQGHLVMEKLKVVSMDYGGTVWFNKVPDLDILLVRDIGWQEDVPAYRCTWVYRNFRKIGQLHVLIDRKAEPAAKLLGIELQWAETIMSKCAKGSDIW